MGLSKKSASSWSSDAPIDLERGRGISFSVAGLAGGEEAEIAQPAVSSAKGQSARLDARRFESFKVPPPSGRGAAGRSRSTTGGGETAHQDVDVEVAPSSSSPPIAFRPPPQLRAPSKRASLLAMLSPAAGGDEPRHPQKRTSKFVVGHDGALIQNPAFDQRTATVDAAGPSKSGSSSPSRKKPASNGGDIELGEVVNMNPVFARGPTFEMAKRASSSATSNPVFTFFSPLEMPYFPSNEAALAHFNKGGAFEFSSYATTSEQMHFIADSRSAKKKKKKKTTPASQAKLDSSMAHWFLCRNPHVMHPSFMIPLPLRKLDLKTLRAGGGMCWLLCCIKYTVCFWTRRCLNAFFGAICRFFYCITVGLCVKLCCKKKYAPSHPLEKACAANLEWNKVFLSALLQHHTSYDTELFKVVRLLKIERGLSGDALKNAVCKIISLRVNVS